MKAGKHKNTFQKTWCLHPDDGGRKLLQKRVCTVRGQRLSYHMQQNKQIQPLPTTPMSAPLHTPHITLLPTEATEVYKVFIVMILIHSMDIQGEWSQSSTHS